MGFILMWFPFLHNFCIFYLKIMFFQRTKYIIYWCLVIWTIFKTLPLFSLNLIRILFWSEDFLDGFLPHAFNCILLYCLFTYLCDFEIYCKTIVNENNLFCNLLYCITIKSEYAKRSFNIFSQNPSSYLPPNAHL